MHNYCLIFSITSFTSCVAAILTVIMIDEKSDKLKFAKYFGDQTQNNEDDKYLKLGTVEKEPSEKDKHPIRLLLDINNVKLIVISFLKKRPSHGRAQIWLIQVVLFFGALQQNAPNSFQFQFVEKIYDWNAQTFSYVTSFGKIGNTFMSLVIVPILIKVSGMRLS